MFGSVKNISKAAASPVAIPVIVWTPDQLPHIQELLSAIEKKRVPVAQENQRAQDLAARIERLSSQISALIKTKNAMMQKWVANPSFVDEDQPSRDAEIDNSQRALQDLTNKESALATSRANSGAGEHLQEAMDAYEAACAAVRHDRRAFHRDRALDRFVDVLLQNHLDLVEEGFATLDEKYIVIELMNSVDDIRLPDNFLKHLHAKSMELFSKV